MKKILVVLILVSGILATNKVVVENIPHTVVKESYWLKSDDSYFKQCMKSAECIILKQALYWEARGEPDKGVIAVAYVILNRAKHPTQWPSTIKGVIEQPWQFSYRMEGNYQNGFTDKKQHRRMAIIAQKVLEGELKNPVGDSTYYHRWDVSNKWTKMKRKVVQIGNHVFRQ